MEECRRGWAVLGLYDRAVVEVVWIVIRHGGFHVHVGGRAVALVEVKSSSCSQTATRTVNALPVTM
jgi:hypothetical protein